MKRPARMKPAKAPPQIDLQLGDKVLLGLAGISDPLDWHLGEVLWTDGKEVLVQQYGIAGQRPHKMLHEMSYVRAVGDIADLIAFRDAAWAEVDALARIVTEREHELGLARDAMWTKLGEIGSAVPRLLKPADGQRLEASE